jgi:hypothetical protein
LAVGTGRRSARLTRRLLALCALRALRLPRLALLSWLSLLSEVGRRTLLVASRTAGLLAVRCLHRRRLLLILLLLVRGRAITTIASILLLRRTAPLGWTLLVRLILRLLLERRLLRGLLGRLSLRSAGNLVLAGRGCESGRGLRGRGGRLGRCSSDACRRSARSGLWLGVAAGRRSDVENGIDVCGNGLDLCTKLILDAVQVVPVFNLLDQLQLRNSA